MGFPLDATQDIERHEANVKRQTLLRKRDRFYAHSVGVVDKRVLKLLTDIIESTGTHKYDFDTESYSFLIE